MVVVAVAVILQLVKLGKEKVWRGRCWRVGGMAKMQTNKKASSKVAKVTRRNLKV